TSQLGLLNSPIARVSNRLRIVMDSGGRFRPTGAVLSHCSARLILTANTAGPTLARSDSKWIRLENPAITSILDTAHANRKSSHCYSIASTGRIAVVRR